MNVLVRIACPDGGWSVDLDVPTEGKSKLAAGKLVMAAIRKQYPKADLERTERGNIVVTVPKT